MSDNSAGVPFIITIGPVRPDAGVAIRPGGVP